MDNERNMNDTTPAGDAPGGEPSPEAAPSAEASSPEASSPQAAPTEPSSPEAAPEAPSTETLSTDAPSTDAPSEPSEPTAPSEPTEPAPEAAAPSSSDSGTPTEASSTEAPSKTRTERRAERQNHTKREKTPKAPKASKAEKTGKKKKKKKGSFTTVLLTLILLAGVCVLAYPTTSDWWNSRHSSQAIAGYVQAIEDMSEDERTQMLWQARVYNASLATGVHLELSETEMEKYLSILDITGTGIMGYLQIPSIEVSLPIYHTADETVLQIAIGHIPGTSLPVGGPTTHAVLSGHRGLPSARLLTDLDKLVVGDVFTVNSLGETVTYMVDQIRIVLPEQTEDLAIERGRDYVTLVTCTPYGVNSHRMLVRGKRIENAAEAVVVLGEATKVPVYIVAPALGVPLLFLLLLFMLIYYSVKPKRKSQKELLEQLKKS